MKAPIYAWVITRDKDQDTENQLVALRSYAERLGYTGYKDYVDHESGGKSDRAQFQRVFVDAHQRRYDVVLFWALFCSRREGTVAMLTSWSAWPRPT